MFSHSSPEQSACQVKKIYSNNNIVLVWHVKNMLEQQGIEVETRNDRLYSVAGELPVTECMGEVWVVSALYYQTAERLVSEMELASLPEFDAWVCHACHEKVDGTFAVCWNCQAAPAVPAVGATQ